LSGTELLQLAKNSFCASFASAEQKLVWQEELDAYGKRHLN
jgi:hypothetical protein